MDRRVRRLRGSCTFSFAPPALAVGLRPGGPVGGASDYAVGARAMGAILNKLSESSHGHHAYSYYSFSPERSTNGPLSDSAGRVQPPSSPSLRIYLSSVGWLWAERPPGKRPAEVLRGISRKIAARISLSPVRGTCGTGSLKSTFRRTTSRATFAGGHAGGSGRWPAA